MLLPLIGFRNHKEVVVDYAIVDDEDSYLNQYSWCRLTNGYARTSYFENGKKVYVPLHRMVVSAKDGQIVDHINRNKLDCRKENLRFCTTQQNARNRNSTKNKIHSEYIGVTFCKHHKKYKSQITVNNKNILIGYYSDEVEAAKARDKKSVELFGEFAVLNFD